MTPWTPDVELDDAIALWLLSERFPDLGPIDLKQLGAGWDNHAYLVNGSVVFRIPHRRLGGELMETELQALQYLNGQDLPLPIPTPQYLALADEGFPYCIAGYPLLEGFTADSLEWTPGQRALNAVPLAQFISKLHAVPAEVPFAPPDKIRRADLPYRLSTMKGRLGGAPSGFGDLLEELAATPPAEKGVWVHGNLYTRHLIVNASHEVSGVIDWGDVHVGNPALDLAIGWMFLPSNAWQEFKQAYGGVDKNTWRRAHFRAMTYWIYLSDYARDRNDKNLMRELEFILENVMIPFHSIPFDDSIR